MTLYLADACALIGYGNGDPKFPPGIRRLITEDAPSIAVASTTIWEIGIKTALGKLDDIRDPVFPSLAAMLRAHGYELMPLDAETAEQAAALPRLHADPFDRALVALAQRTGRTVLTNDRAVLRYAVPTLWQ